MVLARAGSSVMRLAARPVGAQSSSFHPFARECQNGPDDGGLANARTASHDHHLTTSANRIGSDLAFSEG